jgi:tyrosyl-DNA phosphodiesterase 2
MYRPTSHTPGRTALLEQARFESGQWRESAPGTAPRVAPPERLRVMTMNVWFGDLEWERRCDAILAMIAEHRPHLVGLQEVTERFLERALRHPAIREYTLSDAWGPTLGSYGVWMLSRLPLHQITLTDLPTNMGRKLLAADVALEGGPLRFATVHLESLSDYGLARANQLKRIFPLLGETPEAILCGDFNFHEDARFETEALDPAYLDLWRARHPTHPGFTEDTDVNLMRLDIKAREKHVRYDRVLLRSRRWVVAEIHRLGKEPVSADRPRIFPSDHFGVLADLSCESPR